MRLILVRHGQTQANLTRALDTAEPGSPLTAEGHVQAARVADALAAEGIRGIFTSHLLRTRQTARPLADRLGIDPVVLPGIREIVAADLEMRSDLESIIEYHSVADAWAHGHLDRRMPGGESGHEVFARFGGAVEEARGLVGDGAAVLFSHGAIIRTWSGYHGRNIDPDFATSRILANTGMVVLDEGPAGWLVRRWMDETPGEPPSRVSRPAVS